jgi:COP9 signalosome complex subunit 8
VAVKLATVDGAISTFWFKIYQSILLINHRPAFFFFFYLFFCREDARFVYKRTPKDIIKSNSDIQAAFILLQRLWVRDYEGIWGALAYSWPAPVQGLVAALRTELQERMLVLVQKAYSNISISNLSRLLGISEQETASVVAQRDWEVQENGLVIPAPPAVASTFEPSEADLQKIAQYVVFLQAGEALPPAAAHT